MNNKICNNASNDAIDKAIKKIRKRDKRRIKSYFHHLFIKNEILRRNWFYNIFSSYTSNNILYFTFIDIITFI